MSNSYEQLTGYLYNDAAVLIGKGYSGQPPHKNDPSAENMRGIGPIPFGTYTIVELIQNDGKLGPYVLVLEPDATTRQRILEFDRDPDTFRCHGERETPPPGYASDGCIVMPRAVREMLWTGTDHIIDVVVQLETDHGIQS